VRVLVVVAHPDDEVLGCGGTVARLCASGSIVTACILAGNAEARSGRPSVEILHAQTQSAQQALGATEPILGDFPNIQLNTVPQLRLVEFIESAILATRAEVILTHHPGDVNIDHLHTSLACQAAARLSQRQSGVPPLKALLFMEVQSSTEWSFGGGASPFVPEAFMEIGEEGLQAKLLALSVYNDVMRPYPHPRSPEAIRGLALFRGSQAGMRFAEAFRSGYMDLGSAFAAGGGAPVP
jgi:LmbE family N-acetylglucosaminyl deacetylase